MDDILSAVWPEWQFVKELGRGSFGVVYEAVRREHQMESRAAIKVITIPQSESEIDSLRSEGLSKADARTYFRGVVNDFLNEISLMESLKGVQNIVSVEDYKVVEKTDGIGWTIYIRMELLTPFSSYIRDKTLSEAEVIKLGIDICTALELCAKRNIIHRDIKPENIFINDFGYFKLGDFGIARTLESTSGSFSQKGTYNYMAPEVEKGTYYDATVDIYSLGLVLYRLMNNNRLPFLDTDKQLLSPNERANALRRRMDGEPLPPPRGASPAMADLILTACAFDPKQRFASAAAMKNALINAAKGADNVNPVKQPEIPKNAPDNNATWRAGKPRDNDATWRARKPIKTASGSGGNAKAQSKPLKIIAAALAAVILLGAAVFVSLKIAQTFKDKPVDNEPDKTPKPAAAPTESTLTPILMLTSVPTPTVKPTPKPDPTPVTFRDPTFEAAFRSKYGYSADEVITKGTVLSYTELELPGCELADIADAAMFENLTKLNLGYYDDDSNHRHNNQISDVSPLSGLIKLTELDLGGNEITDISPLSGLTNLTELDLLYNEISDINPLSRLTNLMRLDLSWQCYYNENDEKVYTLSDINPLSVLTNLTELRLGDNQIANISSLSRLTNLTKLDLGDNAISDISPLSGLTELTELYLWGSEISDLSLLSRLTNLAKLNLGSCKISDISRLSGLTKLTELWLSSNQITDISPLSELTNLESLSLSNNGITDTKLVEFANTLSKLTKLTELDLGYNKISDISPLSGLTELTELNLYENKITDITPLSELTKLTELNLRCNEISDITPLAGLTNLTELRLIENKITDISLLAGLTKLTELYLEENRISDISPLAGLTKLTELSLGYNNLTASTDISPLFNLTLLKTLFIEYGNELTQSQIDAIQSHLPNCEIH